MILRFGKNLVLDKSESGNRRCESERVMNLANRIFIGALLGWAYSLSLGLLFAIVLSENRSPRELLLPRVIPATLTGRV